ncbi:MAG TPA: hypothetical protein VF765_31845 [Polyangiaceae bacterium]
MARFLPLALGALAVAACSVDTIPTALRTTPPGTGPAVVFDMLATPLPDIPTPNDVATVPDPTSRTGRRLNASLVAPTRLERAARQQFDEMEGWGTYAPITVRFAPEPGQPAGEAAIDLQDMQNRMSGDGWDLSNDPVYVVNLTTGVPVLLDAGSGNYPLTVLDNSLYFPNDPRVSSQNLVFETANEAVGACADGVYRPQCDTDFDGVLDRPNTLGPAEPPLIDGVDNLLTWYERQTDTMVLQPVLPMQEKTEYAVVLTDRLRGPDGQAVRSPFPAVYHPSQESGISRLQAILSDGSRSNYYGSMAGTGLDHVAFAWTFTTEPVQEDMTLLRDGIYGKGPFSYFANDFPPSSLQASNLVGTAVDPADETAGWQQTPSCKKLLKTPYIVHWADVKPALTPFLQLLGQAFQGSFSQAQLDQFTAGLDEYVDYLVIGTYDSPYLMGDPQSTDPDLHFNVNFQTGAGDVRHTPIPWMAVVPKTTAAHKPPFPVAYWRHGTSIFDLEIVVHAAKYAREGIAIVSMDAPGHGLVLSPGEKTLLGALLKGACLGPTATAMSAGRAIDLNGDGTPDSGGLIWSAHLMHTRDGMRQSVLDGVQLNRIFKGFDGRTKSGQDYNANGDAGDDLAGDFNGDGTPDFGGTKVTYSSSGGSFGGLVAQISGAIDPTFGPTIPVSGGGGFVNIATRSKLTPDPVLEEIIGPLIVAVPASARPPTSTGPVTQCTGKQLSVRWVVDNLLDSSEIEIACLEPTELASGMTVVAIDVDTGIKRCARTLADGGFRVALPTSIGERVSVAVYRGADVVESYASCNVKPGATLVRTVDTWEQPATSFTPVATPGLTCNAQSGCAQFWQNFYPVGSALVAPQEGLGYQRQSPDFRRLMNLAQAALDPADPINFARLYLLSPANDWNGNPIPPRPIVDVHTVGDFLVPTGTGMAFSRAAGLLPFLPPSAADTMPEYADWATPPALWDAWNGRSPDQVMIDGYEMESVARMKRVPLPAGCGVNYVSPTTMTCASPPANDAATCAQTLYDGDYLGEATQNIYQKHPTPPLRLARVVGMHPSSSAQLDAVWAPRIEGAPFSVDGSWKAGPPVAGMINAYLEPLGDHDWAFGDPCRAWDGVTYMDDLLVHYFATGGTDLYFLTHAKSHECLATQTCPFMQP